MANLDIWIGMMCSLCVISVCAIRKFYKQKRIAKLQRIEKMGILCKRDALLKRVTIMERCLYDGDLF